MPYSLAKKPITETVSYTRASVQSEWGKMCQKTVSDKCVSRSGSMNGNTRLTRDLYAFPFTVVLHALRYLLGGRGFCWLY